MTPAPPRPPDPCRRVAALYDIHGNLPALEAVLEEVRRSDVDLVVVGGDVVPGPMPRETLERLLALDLPVRFIRGNCELAALAQLDAPEAGAATYWGTASGRPLPEPYRTAMRWSAEQVAGHRDLIAGWPRTLRVGIAGLGETLFCHATPRDEAEIFTRRTAEERLRPLFDGLGAPLVVCGHTHMPFDRRVGATRVVNAGSVGAPFGEPGAHWVLLGPDVAPQRTAYDLERTAARIRSLPYPTAEEDARELLRPPAEETMLDLYAGAELTADPGPAGGGAS